MNKIFLIVFLILICPIVNSENNGVLVGNVLDNLNNLVGNVEVKIYCGSDIISGETDEYGAFVINNIPPGSCKAYAKYKNAIGYSNFIISPDQINEIDIVLDKTIIDISQKNNNFLVGLLIFLVIILFFIFRKINFRNSSIKNKKIKKGKHRNKVSISKIDTILKALSQRERQILESLIMHNGETTQAKIRYDTGIPKASLSRHIKNLEQKRIIEVKRIGKVSKIKLLEK